MAILKWQQTLLLYIDRQEILASPLKAVKAAPKDQDKRHDTTMLEEGRRMLCAKKKKRKKTPQLLIRTTSPLCVEGKIFFS